jgi:VWFA-related protein
MRHYPLLCATAILACAACLDSTAQANPATESKTPSYRSTSRAVVVDVVVSRGDEAIRGLNKQDFQILEDGKPQVIDFFEEHSSNSLPAGALPALPKMPEHVYTNVPPAPESDSVNVLLLDTLNTDPQDQTSVKTQILSFLKNMQPGVRVAVFVLGSKLRMVQGFTTDSSVLRDALNDKKNGVSPESDAASRSHQDKVDDGREFFRLTQIMGAPPTTVEAAERMQAGSAAQMANQRVAMTLEALNYMARYLAGVPGRKNLIWFAGSFPVSVFPIAKEKQRISQLREYSAAVKETADLLTVSKVAVYPICAEGVMLDDVMDATGAGPTDTEGFAPDQRSASGASARSGGSGPVAPYSDLNGARADKIMAMEQLAADTGGKAYYNTNDLNAAMMRAIADGAHYYTLAYTPTNKKMDGSYRKIEVKVPEAKYRLAYRHGYNADDLPGAADAKPEANSLHALMMIGMPDATQILFAARVLPASPQPAGGPLAGKNAKLTGPTTRYSVDFMIRWTDVKLDPQPDGTHTGKIDVQLLAYDRDGNAVNWAGGAQMMSLKPDLFAAIQKSGVPAHIDIDLPSGKDVFLSAGVYDWNTGKAGTMEVPLTRATAQGSTLAQSAR